LCEHNRQWLKRAFGLEDDAVRLVYNGVPERYPSEEDQVCAREAVRKELGLPADSRILLTVGRLGIQKGHDLLLPIIDAIVDAFPEAHFVWLGEGDRRPEYEAARAGMRHGDHLHLPGWRPDATPWLFGADLFVFPTYYEGLPRAVMEALSSGPPIVASAVSSIPEILDDGQCGRLVAENTPEAWRESLMFALSNPDEMAALRAAARRRAPRFSEDRMVRETLALIHERLSS
jgi:glycosyltransferase involved in cell wall biosynthesis